MKKLELDLMEKFFQNREDSNKSMHMEFLEENNQEKEQFKEDEYGLLFKRERNEGKIDTSNNES